MTELGHILKELDELREEIAKMRERVARLESCPATPFRRICSIIEE